LTATLRGCSLRGRALEDLFLCALNQFPEFVVYLLYEHKGRGGKAPTTGRHLYKNCSLRSASSLIAISSCCHFVVSFSTATIAATHGGADVFASAIVFCSLLSIHPSQSIQ
jgi:hypothetical protein